MIDRLVLDYHACATQEEVDALFDKIGDEQTDSLLARLHELFPPDPNECDSSPYGTRIGLLNRGLDEFDATMIGRCKARSCVEREGRTIPCKSCEAYLADFPAPE